MYHIQKLCTHALWLKDGRVERYGAAADVTQAYLAYHEEKDAHARRPVSADRAAASGWYAINALTVEPAEHARAGRRAHGARRSVLAGRPRPGRADRHRARGWHAGVWRGHRHGELRRRCALAEHRYAFSLTFPDVALLPGRYQVRAHALDPEGVRLFDHVEHTLTVTGATRELGFVRLPHRWQSPA